MNTPSMQIHTIRLKPQQDLLAELEAFVQQHDVEAGLILTCVGSLTDAVLRLANQPDGSHYSGHFEIVSLVGTLSTNGSHLHLSFSDSQGVTLGGHLFPGCRVYTTAEIVIGVLPEVCYQREFDPASGYEELTVYPQSIS